MRRLVGCVLTSSFLCSAVLTIYGLLTTTVLSPASDYTNGCSNYQTCAANVICPIPFCNYNGECKASSGTVTVGNVTYNFDHVQITSQYGTNSYCIDTQNMSSCTANGSSTDCYFQRYFYGGPSGHECDSAYQVYSQTIQRNTCS